MGLEGKVVLITGAGQGIGRACAWAFLEQGARLVLIDKNRQTLKDLLSQIKRKGGNAKGYVFDLTRTKRIDRLVERIESQTPVDVLVNNAGFDRPGLSSKIGIEDFHMVMVIHVYVPFLLSKHLLPGMKQRGFGRIINVSSVYGKEGAKGELAYSTAKAAIIGFTKSLAREADVGDVTVNCVVPGLVHTETIERMPEKYKEMILSRTILKRMGTPQEVANVIVFLASERASYITGSEILVSGGWGI